VGKKISMQLKAKERGNTNQQNKSTENKIITLAMKNTRTNKQKKKRKKDNLLLDMSAKFH
jgi:hypothetical protein